MLIDGTVVGQRSGAPLAKHQRLGGRGEGDAAEWLPELNRCWFAAVRQEYGLTIDRREADALDAVLEGCE